MGHDLFNTKIREVASTDFQIVNKTKTFYTKEKHVSSGKTGSKEIVSGL